MSTAAPANPSKPTGKNSYEVCRPHGTCAACAKPIEPDAKFTAVLRENPAGFERLDVCISCAPGLDRSGALAVWQTKMPRAEQKKKLLVDDEVLTELYIRLADTTEPSKLNFRFVLGLILMRKKIVLYESSRQDETREIWTLRFRGKDDRIDMLNPHLTEEQVGEVSQQMGEILNQEL